jgi:uncharacterized NAD(P)/FAD-binding protein YdhS
MLSTGRMPAARILRGRIICRIGRDDRQTYPAQSGFQYIDVTRMTPPTSPDGGFVTTQPSVPCRSGSDGGSRPVVAIIGAGFSGTMAAIHLRHTLPPDHVVTLFDQTGRFARGPAYAATDAAHLLNVRAMNMSAFAEDPGHFDRWLDSAAAHLPGEVRNTEAGRFATRRLYGRYLRALLYAEMRQSGGRVRLAGEEIVAIARAAQGWRLTCASGRSLAAAAVVLAIGNLPSRSGTQGGVFHDPWTEGATHGLRPDTPVLVVGTGLTMVDLALDMRARGFAGPIIAVSRRGLLPHRHALIGGTWPAPVFAPAERGSLAALLRRFRAELRHAAAQGVDWRAVIDGLRPITAELWRGLPLADRTRFLRHLRPYWDVHRHRLAAPAADRLASLLRDGSLQRRRGRLVAVERQGDDLLVSILGHGAAAPEAVRVQRLIYATGVQRADATDGLISGLCVQGLARTDPHGIGLEVTQALEVIGTAGVPVPGLWALGPIVRGVFWECTAVPDIRVQARLVAERISAGLASLATD